MDIHRHGIPLPMSTKTAREAAQMASTVLMDGARQVGESLTQPDDDWAPLWLVVTQTQGTIITTDPGALSDPRFKEKITNYVGGFARKVGAIAIAQVASTWQVALGVEVGPERMAEVMAQINAQDGSTEGIAERYEAVFVAAYTADSFSGMIARIERYPDAPPTLGEFIAMPSKGLPEGRMAEPLQQALRRLG